MTVDRNIDERRNTQTATRAALDYLSELRQLLGSWTPAAAAYNMGEDGLQGEMLAQGETDYYRSASPGNPEVCISNRRNQTDYCRPCALRI